MDIYFCDLCGNRVNDFDLKSGRSIRRVHDVICATCLELGHGKEWLSKHQAKATVPFAHRNPAPSANADAATVSAPVRLAATMAAAAGSSLSSAPAHGVIDTARDRAVTFEGNEEQTVDATGMARPIPVSLEADDLIEPPVAPAVPASPAAPTPPTQPAAKTPVERPASPPRPAMKSQANQLSSAAASFSALSSTPVKETSASHHSDDDLDGIDQPLVADSPTPDKPAAMIADNAVGSAQPDHGGVGLGDAIHDAVTDAERLGKQEDPEQTKAREKAETLPSNPLQTNVEAPTRDRAKEGKASSPASPSPISKKSQAQNKSGSTSKIAKNKSGKQSVRRNAKRSDKLVIVITCITLPVLAGFMLWLTVLRPSPERAQPVENVNLTAALVQTIDAASKQVKKALDAPVKNLDDLNLAIEKIQAIDRSIEEFEKVASTKNWTAEDVENEMERLHVHDVKKRMHELTEERAKIQINQ